MSAAAFIYPVAAFDSMINQFGYTRLQLIIGGAGILLLLEACRRVVGAPIVVISLCFVGIGLFASAITNNQIVAFIVAVVLSVFMYLGFEGIYQMGFLGKADLFIKSLGMRHHYESISRGVIDTRDLLYYLSVIAIAVMATRMVLQSRKWKRG